MTARRTQDDPLVRGIDSEVNLGPGVTCPIVTVL